MSRYGYDRTSWYPDSDKVTMARALDALRRDGAKLDDGVARAVDNVLRTYRSAQQDAMLERAREDDHRAKLAAVLDSDEPITTSQRCQASTNTSSYRTSYCRHTAKWMRRWTTSQFSHLRLDGVDLERVDGTWMIGEQWVIGKGFTKRPITDEESERAERVYTETAHEVALCGVHRRQAGQYGLPY